MSATPTIVCPNCGAVVPGRNGEPPKFCGQCGTTISADTSLRDIHEEVTVARSLPSLESYLSSAAQPKGAFGKTMLDASPFGAQAPQDASPPAPAPAPPAGAPRTQMMASTLADPEVAARAQEMRDAALASSRATAEPPAPPKSAFGGTIQMNASPAPPSLAGTMPINPGTQLGMPMREPIGSSAPADPQPAFPRVNPGTQLGMPGAPLPEPPPALKTMFGMPASDLPAPPPAHAAPPPTQLPDHAPPPPPPLKTMLGVAIPGIAPTQSDPNAPPPLIDPADLRSKQSTMLGVAIPGIAPTHERGGGTVALNASPNPAPYGYTAQGKPAPAPYMPSQVQNTALGMMAVVADDVPIVPRPKTLLDMPAPVMPALPQKKGISALAVVGIVAAIVIVAGGAFGFIAYKRSLQVLTAVPQLDENGKESLKVACPTCADGTKVSLGASTATVTGGNALLPLPAPLTIGENDLTVKVDRPGVGRDEDVKVKVTVGYRVRADLTTLSSKPPTITVRVETSPGTDVKVEGKPVTIDASGKGSYAIDLSKETEGVGEAKPYERKIPFVVTPKGGPAQNDELTARTAILPLALDAPGSELYTDKTSAAIAGTTRPGATLTVDGQNVTVDAQGHFGVRVELPAIGPKPLEIEASSTPQAPRIAKVKVTRVASLDAEAKELEAQSPLAYDAFGADPASKIGQKAVVEGEVVDVRVAAGHTVLVVDAKRGCTKGATCVVRVKHGDEDGVAKGAQVRAYGHVTGAVASNGKTVPEVEASLVQQTKAAK